jgi:hypothetical protein
MWGICRAGRRRHAAAQPQHLLQQLLQQKRTIKPARDSRMKP